MEANWCGAAGAVVKRLRCKNKLTQQDLADKAGFARSYILKIERGKANISVAALVALAKALKIKPHKLFLQIEIEVNKDAT